MVLTLLKRIVGQSGGADFLDCKAGEGKMVKTLTTYADGERVRFIKLTYSDNTTSSTHGYQSWTIHEIRFEPGERVTWVTLWTDDRYKDLARIQLSTTYNKHIDGGGYWKGYTPYSINVGSGYLVGATGNAKSAYVKALGLIFLIEVTKTTISNVVYDPPQANLIWILRLLITGEAQASLTGKSQILKSDPTRPVSPRQPPKHSLLM